MATTTQLQLLDQLIDDIDGLGFSFILATVNNAAATATSTDPELNKKDSDGNPVLERYMGKWLYIPSAAAPDRQRTIQSIAVSAAGTTTFTTNGPTYSADQTTITAYLLAIDPRLLRNLFNNALVEEMMEIHIPLEVGPTDYDMSIDSGVTNWTDGTSGGSRAKQTTAAEVFSGLRSLKVVAGAAAGYVRSTVVRLPQNNRGVIVRGIMKADIGSWTVRLRDSAATSINTVTAITDEEWVYFEKDIAPASTVEGVSLDIEGLTVSDEADVDCVGIVPRGAAFFNLPDTTWITETFKLKYLAWAEYKVSVKTDQWWARSRVLHRIEDDDYRVAIGHSEANPYTIELHNSRLLDKQLWVLARVPYSLLTTYTDGGTETTTCPLNVLAARCIFLIGQHFPAFAEYEGKGRYAIDRRQTPRQTEKPAVAPSAYEIGRWRV